MLLKASEAGHTNSIRVLLEYGANIKVRDKADSNIMHYMVTNNDLDSLNLVKHEKSLIMKKNHYKKSPLTQAIEKKNEKVLDIFASVLKYQDLKKTEYET